MSIDAPPAITITVRLFASLREAAGTDRLELRLPAATPAGAVWGHLPGGVGAAGRPTACATRSTTSGRCPARPLRDGDEVALVLPVSGG